MSPPVKFRTGRTDQDVLAEFVSGFFAPVRAVLSDPSVSEVLINGPEEIFVERGGQLERTGLSFSNERQLLSALRAVAQYLGRPLGEERPILEGRLPDGSRLSAVLAPLAAPGPIVAIRRHRTDTLSLAQLVALGALSEEAVRLLSQLVSQKRNMLVSGGTGSGKTSVLRCIASLIHSQQRIVSIEDARELHLTGAHVVALEARPPDARGRGAISIGDLFLATLRLRPDRIIIGELRGGEALDLIQAMTSGHGGCLSTVHASSPEDALRRLETMALFRGVELPLRALRSQVASAVDVIVQVERSTEGRRWVRAIAEVLPLSHDGQYRVKMLLERDQRGHLKSPEHVHGP